MDLKEAIDRVVELAHDAQSPSFHQVSAEQPHRYWMCRPGQPPEMIEAPKPPRSVRCSSIDGVCQAVSELHAGVEGEPFVYVGERGVFCHLAEFGDRRDAVSMPFFKTDQMQAVERLVEEPTAQPDLVWLLRSTLAGCCTHPQFPTMVRKLRVKNNEDGERSLGVGRESIGASVVKEMAGIDGDLPETVEFVVPVYEEVWHDTQAGKRHAETIELAVNVDLQNMAFVFRPTGSSVRDALMNARRQALVQLREKLQGVAVVIEESAVG